MAEEERILEVTPDFDGKRIDQCLAASFSDCSRSFLQKLLKDGKVSINGKTQKASSKVAAGDAVLVLLPEPEELNVEPENIPLDILYEDDDLLVVNKPKGMVVHPAAGHSSGTLVNAVLYHCRGNLSGINGVLRPGIVHRIDMDTTGALVICKSDFAHQSLAEQLSVHSITRKYRAIVHGNLKEDEGTVRGAIGRHPTDRKKMAINERNVNRRSHITVCWNALEIIRILNASWKPAGRIRFVSIWQVSGIRCLAMRFMARRNAR